MRRRQHVTPFVSREHHYARVRAVQRRLTDEAAAARDPLC